MPLPRHAFPIALLALCAIGGAALAAPPPPPRPGSGPPGSESVIEGYNMRVFYGGWRTFIDQRKGDATRAVLASPEALPGEQASGAPLLGVDVSWEAGTERSDLRRYCDAAAPTRCHYRFRWAVVDHELIDESRPNPPADFMREAFDPAVVVARLKELGYPPTSNWGPPSMARVYEALPDPVPMLIANTTVRVVDSRTCPGLLAAIEAADPRPLTSRRDFPGLAEDRREAPPPHAAYATYWLSIPPKGGGEAVLVRGSGPALESHVRPILEAAASCRG